MVGVQLLHYLKDVLTSTTLLLRSPRQKRERPLDPCSWPESNDMPNGNVVQALFQEAAICT